MTSHDALPLAGILGDRYRIERELGHGGIARAIQLRHSLLWRIARCDLKLPPTGFRNQAHQSMRS